MKLFKIVKQLVGITLVIFTLPGCAVLLVGAGAAIGAGTVAFVGGELKGAESVSFSRGWNASLAAVKQLGFYVTSQDHDNLSGKIIARTSEDKKITIKIKKQSESVTEFRIRVGTFGDETLSRMIYNQIKKNL